MPGFDGTGPRGAGPMTGGGFGYCGPAGPVGGRGMGFGRGAFGGRGGMGRRWFGGYRGPVPYQVPARPETTPEEYLAWLESEVARTKEQIGQGS
ncbi:MAG: DUF5320 domain-containing protein [Desulfovibrio sp.]|nr:DUF5320 domain-containing protein [Desulfovibrio sp.]